MSTPKLGIYKLHPNVKLPRVATDQSACFDVRLCLDHAENVAVYTSDNQESQIPMTVLWKNKIAGKEASKQDLRLVIAPGERLLAPTGIIFDIPDGYSLRLHSRSSLSWKKGLRLGNSEGIIDSDYFHETFVMLQNTGTRAVSLENGERICQAELVEVKELTFAEIETKPCQTTDRTGGLGSTGTK